ncbi:MAG TPA: hypothetical protein VI968_01765 [archaeon]|nr:hypothetical protein [archaeon]
MRFAIDEVATYLKDIIGSTVPKEDIETALNIGYAGATGTQRNMPGFRSCVTILKGRGFITKKGDVYTVSQSLSEYLPLQLDTEAAEVGLFVTGESNTTIM